MDTPFPGSSQKVNYFEEEDVFPSMQNTQQLTAIKEEHRSLNIFDQLNHNNFKVRTFAYKKLEQVFNKQVALEEVTSENVAKQFYPWLKNILKDSNMVALNYGLSAVIAYLNHQTYEKSIVTYLIIDLLDLGPQSKKKIIYYQEQIFQKLMSLDTEQQIPIEILKKIHSKNSKVGTFLQKRLIQYMHTFDEIHADVLKQILRSSAQFFENISAKIRKNAIEIIQRAYSLCGDQAVILIDKYFSKIRDVQKKEVILGLSKAKKLKQGQVILIKQNEKVEVQTGQNVNLMKILPEKTLEIPYLQNIESKISLMQRINGILEKEESCNIDQERDYSQFFNVLTKVLDQQNFLLLTEAFICLNHSFRIFGHKIPSNKVKQFVVLITERLTGKEKTYNTLNAYELLSNSLTYNCISIMKILEIVFNKIEFHKSQGVVRGCLKWLQEHFMKSFYEQDTEMKDPAGQNRMWSVEESLEYLFGDDKFSFQHDPAQRKRILMKMQKKLVKIIKNTKLKTKCKSLLKMVHLAQENKLINVNQKPQKQPPRKKKMGLKIRPEQMHNQNPLNTSNLSNNSCHRIKQNIIDEKSTETKESNNKAKVFHCPDSKCQFLPSKVLKAFKEHLAMEGPDSSFNQLVCSFHPACLQSLMKNLMSAIYNTTLGMYRKTNQIDIWKIISSFSTINKHCVKVSWDDAFKQLNIILIELQEIEVKYKMLEVLCNSIYKTMPLDTLFQVCSSIILNVFEACEETQASTSFNKALILILWLTHKLEKDDTSQFSQENLLSFERIISNLNHGMDNQILEACLTIINQKKSIQKSQQPQPPTQHQDFITPKQTSLTKITFPSQNSNNKQTIPFKEDFTEKFHEIEQTIDKNFGQGVEALMKCLDEAGQSKRRDSMMSTQQFDTPARHWKRKMGRQLTPLKNLTQSHLSQGDTPNINIPYATIQPVFVKVLQKISYHNLARNQQILVQILQAIQATEIEAYLRDVMTVLLTQEWPEISQKLKSEFQLLIQRLFLDIQPSLIIHTYMSVFESPASKSHHNSTLALNDNTLEYLMKLVTDTEPQGKQMELLLKLSPALIISLQSEKLAITTNDFLDLMIQVHGLENLKKQLEIKLMNSNQIYMIFQEWLDFYVDANGVEQSMETNYNQGLEQDIQEDLIKMDLVQQDQQTLLQEGMHTTTEDITQINPLETEIQHPSQTPTKRSPQDRYEPQEMMIIDNLEDYQEEGKQSLTPIIPPGGKENQDIFNQGKSPRLDDFIMMKKEGQPRQMKFEKDFQLSTIQKVDRTMLTNLDSSILQLHHPKVTGRNLEKELHEDETWRQKFHLEQSRNEFTVKMLEKSTTDFDHQQKEKSKIMDLFEKERQRNQELAHQIVALNEKNEVLKDENSHLKFESVKNGSPQVSRIFSQRSTIKCEEIEIFESIKELRNKDYKLYIKKVQQGILVNNFNNNENIYMEMLVHYNSLTTLIEKLDFIQDLKLALKNPKLIEALPEENFQWLLRLSLSLCISKNTQKEIRFNQSQQFQDNELTTQMQVLLDSLLRANKVEMTICILVRIIDECLPEEFMTELTEDQKMLTRLTTKCIERLHQQVDADTQSLAVLLELYKFFKEHPPEDLNQKVPSLKELDAIFRCLRNLFDIVMIKTKDIVGIFTEIFADQKKGSIFVSYALTQLQRFTKIKGNTVFSDN